MFILYIYNWNLETINDFETLNQLYRVELTMFQKLDLDKLSLNYILFEYKDQMNLTLREQFINSDVKYRNNGDSA